MRKKNVMLLAILSLILCISLVLIYFTQKENEDIVIIDGIYRGMSLNAVSSHLGTPISKEVDSLTGGVTAKYQLALDGSGNRVDTTFRFIKSGLVYKLYAVSATYTLNGESSPLVFLEELTDSLVDRYQNNNGYHFEERDGAIIITITDGALITCWELQLNDGKVVARWNAVF